MPRDCFCAMLCVMQGAYLVAPPTSLAHPLGNFSISRYAGLRIAQHVIELRYLLDMAEIPTFLEMQENGIVPEVGHPSLRGYLDRQTTLLQAGLRVEVNGQRLPLQGVASEIVFPLGLVVCRRSSLASCTRPRSRPCASMPVPSALS